MQQPYRILILSASAAGFILSNAFSIFQENDGRSAGEKLYFLLVVALCIGAHYACVYAIANLMQRRYPGLEQTPKRIWPALAYGIPAVGALMAGGDAWQQAIRGEALRAFEAGALWATLFQAVAMSIFIIGLSEAFYHYEQLLVAEKEKEELQRLHLLARYDSLKQQVNPHFLFNSLNSLSSLIRIDPLKAEQFVEEMSGVYRYLLQSNRDELTTLGAELDFTRSYLHLLKTRFGEALQIEMDIPESCHRRAIPPLTLQLLLENAVKHNEASLQRPLRIGVRVAEGRRLEVSNNVQPRILVAPSEKVGLANIMAKYRLLGLGTVGVYADERAFTVSLPLT